MRNGTLLDLVVQKNKALTYAEAKPLIKELASCVNVSYCLIYYLGNNFNAKSYFILFN